MKIKTENKTENKMNVNIENFEKLVDYNAVSGWHAAFKRRQEEAKRIKQQTKNKQNEKS